MRSTSLGLFLVLLLLAGCAGPPRLPERRLSPDNPGDQIGLGLERLRSDDPAGALAAMEAANRAGAARLSPFDSSLFLRDLAELRLARGDDAGAADAAENGLRSLDQVPLTAQFKDEDQQVFRRLLSSLALAGRTNAEQLEALARSDGFPPLADPWYLLGWVREHQGDVSGARQAYQTYLSRTPEFGLLRLTRFMEQHAREVVG